MALSSVIADEIHLLKKKKKKYEKCIESIEECDEYLSNNLECTLTDLNVIYEKLADFSSDNSRGSMIEYFASTAEDKKLEFKQIKLIMTEGQGDVSNRLSRAYEIVEELNEKIKKKENEYQAALSNEYQELLRRMTKKILKE